MAFVLVLQQLDGNVIGPKILGNRTGLSGFWVLFAIILFGGLWGGTGEARAGESKNLCSDGGNAIRHGTVGVFQAISRPLF